MSVMQGRRSGGDDAFGKLPAGHRFVGQQVRWLAKIQRSWNWLHKLAIPKTLKQKSKDNWKNGNQKTHRNDCEQSGEGTKDEETKEGLRVVKGKQQHKETNKPTETPAKEAAETSSKMLTETSQHA